MIFLILNKLYRGQYALQRVHREKKKKIIYKSSFQFTNMYYMTVICPQFIPLTFCQYIF